MMRFPGRFVTQSLDATAPRRAVRTAIIALAVAALSLAGCSSGNAPASRKGSRGGGPATVATEPVARADMPVTLSAIGTVQPITVATVRTQLAGTLFSLHFTEGQMVTQGQLLAQIDPRPYRLALTQAEANLARDTAQLQLARLDLQRYQALLAQDSIARQQVETQNATVRQLGGTVVADRAAVGTARLNLGYTAIRAPVAGRIGLRQADIGNYLTPADANGVAVITRTDPIDVSFSVPQAKLAQIQARAGSVIPATLFDQSNSIAIAEGRFLTLDNQVDPTSGTVKAKARFANANGRLFPSQFVNITLLVDTLTQVPTVPVGAVRHGAKGDFVFVLQPNRTAKLTPVQTGPSTTTRIAILRGLEPGMTVITEGADALDDGSHVRLPGAAKQGQSRGPSRNQHGAKRTDGAAP